MGTRRAERVVDHPSAELVGVSDVDGSLADATGAEFGVEAVTDHETLLDRDPDCVIISVPNKFHAPIATDAMERGVHVFCEKPLARTVDEAREMVATAMAEDVYLKVGSNLRYFRAIQRFQELVADGAVGDPMFLRGWIGNDGSHLDGSWFAEEELSGGGTFLDNGCHVLDIARWLLGEVVECTGHTATLHHPIDVEDNGIGIFRFADGELAVLQSSWTEWDGYAYLQLYGDEGSITADVRHPSATVTVRTPAGYGETEDFSGLSPTSYDDEFEHFLAALTGDSHPEPSGFDGLRAVQMAHAVYESDATGRTVDLWETADQSLERDYASEFPLVTND